MIRRVVPWKNRAEFHRVYEDLYSQKLENQKHALGHLLVWKSRALNRLPVAIECTSTLVQACVFHNSLASSSCNNFENEENIRTNYALALIRFVNHITENKQNAAMVLPIQMIANEVGVPEWIVDLRHSATHGSLPSLPLLQSGVHWALQWLKDEFWEPQIEAGDPRKHSVDPDLPSTAKESQTLTKNDVPRIKEAIEEYIQARLLETAKSKSGRKKAPKSFTATECVGHDLLLNSGTNLIDGLLSYGYLLPNERSLKMMNITTQDLVKEDGNVGEVLLNIWKPMLSKCFSLGGREKFVDKVTSLLSGTENKKRRQLLVAWLLFSLNGKITNQAIVRKVLFSLSCKLDKSIAIIANRILSMESGLNEIQKIQLEKLLSIFQGDSKDTCISTDENQTLFTLKDLPVPAVRNSEENIVGRMHSQNKVDKEQLSPLVQTSGEKRKWHLCTEQIHWSEIPIGGLLNPTDAHSLELHVASLPDLRGGNSQDSMLENNSYGNERDSMFEEEYDCAPNILNPLWSEKEMKEIYDNIKIVQHVDIKTPTEDKF